MPKLAKTPGASGARLPDSDDCLITVRSVNQAAQRSIAVTLVLVGFVMGAVGLTLDLNGGPSWLHAITWVGGAVFGYGIVSLIQTGRKTLS